MRCKKISKDDIDETDFLMGCEVSCPSVRDKMFEISQLKVEMEELKRKSSEIKDFETIRFTIENDNDISNNYINVFKQAINFIQPIYNYIRKEVKSFEKILAVFLHQKVNEIYDLWFIIEEDDFNLEMSISKIIGDLIEIFDPILFDSLSFTKNEIDIENFIMDDYEVIFLRR